MNPRVKSRSNTPFLRLSIIGIGRLLGEEQKADVQDVISPKAVSLFKRLYHLRSHRLLIFIFLVDIRKNNER